MLIRPGLGSYFFIASLLTTLPMEKIAKITTKKNYIANLNCNSCTLCLEACPTNALTKEYTLDANKCLSYLTIEHRDTVPSEYLPFFKDTLYGCDICQDVCPYNKVTLDSFLIPEFAEYHLPFTTINAVQVAQMTFAQYEEWFGGTAATRAKYEGLVRNSLYHLYTTKHENLVELCQQASVSSFALVQKTASQILGLIKKNTFLPTPG